MYNNFFILNKRSPIKSNDFQQLSKHYSIELTSFYFTNLILHRSMQLNSLFPQVNAHGAGCSFDHSELHVSSHSAGHPIGNLPEGHHVLVVS